MVDHFLFLFSVDSGFPAVFFQEIGYTGLSVGRVEQVYGPIIIAVLGIVFDIGGHELGDAHGPCKGAFYRQRINVFLGSKFQKGL